MTGDTGPKSYGGFTEFMGMPQLRSSMRDVIRLISSSTSRKGISIILDQGVVSGSNFITGVILGRACSKDEFGLYMLGFSIVFFVIDLQFALISTPYMIYSPRLKGLENAEYTGSTMIHQLILSFFVVLAALGGAYLTSAYGIGPQGLPNILRTLGMVISFIMFREYVRRVAFSQFKIGLVLLLDLLITVLQVGGVIALVHFASISAATTFLVIGLACGLASVGWVISNRRNLVFSLKWAITHLEGNWAIGRWVFASGLLWTLSMSVYPWLIVAFKGAAATGTWAACLGVVSVVNPVLLGIQNFSGPKIATFFAENGPTALRRFVFRVNVLTSIIVAPIVLILLFFGETLVSTIYGPKYVGNGRVVYLLAMNVLVSASAFSFSRVLFAIERADLDFAVNFSALVFLVLIGVWLVKMFGPFGAAVGLLSGNIIATIARYIVFRKLVLIKESH